MKTDETIISLIKKIGIIIILLILILFIIERTYNYPNKIKENNNSREDYINLYQDTEFNNIFEYLEAADAGYESKFKNLDENIGCYDNDKLIEDIKGKGETCKTISSNIQNIYATNLLHSNGNKYSFAELCPETSGQERPILCLYNKGNYINNITQKLSNLINNVQIEQNNRLDNLEKSINTHTIDPNRLYNMEPVKAYNKYENNMNMGIERRYNIGDQLDDLITYSKRLKSNI